jgi:hypothetical protein
MGELRGRLRRLRTVELERTVGFGRERRVWVGGPATDNDAHEVPSDPRPGLLLSRRHAQPR